MDGNLIFERLSKNIEKPKVELNYSNAFQLTIAVLLSARTTDKQVNKVTNTLFKKFFKPEDLYKFDNLENEIKTIGLYKTKAKHIQELCQILIEKFNGEIPSNLKDLTSLPGIGRKSANVILSEIFQQNAIAVDTHVNRVAKRLGIATSKDSVLAVEKKLMSAIPEKWQRSANSYLVLHGRYTCTARNPKCNECPLKDMCDYYKNNK